MQTGDIVWRFTTSRGIYATPLLEDDGVYFGSGDGYFYCLNPENGEVRWRYRAGALIKNRAVCAGNKVIFGGWDRTIHALDRATGESHWSYKVSSNRYFAAATSNPVVTDNKVIISSHDHVVHAIDVTDGQLIWKASGLPGASPGYSTALVDNERICFGSLILSQPVNQVVVRLFHHSFSLTEVSSFCTPKKTLPHRHKIHKSHVHIRFIWT